MAFEFTQLSSTDIDSIFTKKSNYSPKSVEMIMATFAEEIEKVLKGEKSKSRKVSWVHKDGVLSVKLSYGAYPIAWTTKTKNAEDYLAGVAAAMHKGDVSAKFRDQVADSQKKMREDMANRRPKK